MLLIFLFFFFFNAPATTEIYTLSLHGRSSDLSAGDRCHAWVGQQVCGSPAAIAGVTRSRGFGVRDQRAAEDRKSTRLNSSHANISYAVFCLKKKKINRKHDLGGHCMCTTIKWT